jgi:fluoride ion exporter CrcB/FEX
MVEMMDGTDSMYGPQVAAAFFGYIIGMSCALSSYIAGTHCIECFRLLHPLPQIQLLEGRTSVGESESIVETHRQGKERLFLPFSKLNVFILALTCASLLVGFAFGDAYYGSLMYRELWMASILAPFGAVIRWRFTEYNARELFRAGSNWFPWGTFLANVVAAIICILVTALNTYVVDKDEVSVMWVSPSLGAVGTGFAGSLSTVSSLVHEIIVLETLRQAYSYGVITIVCSMVFSLLIYVPIARFG